MRLLFTIISMEPSNRAIRLEREVAPQDEEQRHLFTLEALAEVDTGEVIDHAFVKAWAEGLFSEEINALSPLD